ncbi:hypothetical protein A5797_002587, partial [Enterococcus faecalis]
KFVILWYYDNITYRKNCLFN